VVSSLAFVTVFFLGYAGGDEAGRPDIPAPFAPFEYLVGRWTGQGVPKDNPSKQFRGWTETHTWAWAFAGGKPVGLTLTIEGGKVLASGKLTFEAGRKLYHLEGVEPRPLGGAIAFEGTLDKTGKYLVLDHNGGGGKGPKSAGTLRLSVWPNANFIRYTMAHDLKEPESVQFTRLIEVGLTKDGESLAGATSIAERPKCIVTGGAATMTMSYQGRTFPICCTGCRDEFNDNPEKYIKKASLLMSAQGSKPKGGQPSATQVSRFEDAFADDVVTTPNPSKAGTVVSSGTMTQRAAGAGTTTPAPAGSPARPESTTDSVRPATAKKSGSGLSLLKLGQSLEKSGNTTAALGYYRRVVKDFAQTAAAKTAGERIKAIDHP
jgi:YHS domain-containing protein